MDTLFHRFAGIVNGVFRDLTGSFSNEIDFKYSDALVAADNFLIFKWMVKTIAARNGLFASFMPKPIKDKSGKKKSLQAGLSVNLETNLLTKISRLTDNLVKALEKLETTLAGNNNHHDTQQMANFYKNEVIPHMQAIRIVSDELETLVGKKYWTLPTYGELLFGI